MLDKVLKALVFIAINIVGLTQVTQAEEKSWKDNSISQDVQDICNKVNILQIPQKDVPSEEEKINLKDCSSRNLYYGISGSQDTISARKCAILEFEKKDNGFVSGAAILMMVYANGEGVEKNAEIAKKMACEMWAAPYELEMRIGYLSEPDYKPIDICDHITSGAMMGFCASISSDMAENKASTDMQKITAKWSEEHKNIFTKLNDSAKKYFESHASKEIDMSGTMRVAYYVAEKDYMFNEFRKSIYELEKSGKTSYIKSDFINADNGLNTEYRDSMKRQYDEISGVTKDGIKATQLLWIKYRDAWVRFASLHYPAIDTDIIKTKLTYERTAILRNIPTSISE